MEECSFWELCSLGLIEEAEDAVSLSADIQRIPKVISVCCWSYHLLHHPMMIFFSAGVSN